MKSVHSVKENSPCVWMSAGLVKYKLCNQDFDCENCSFDKVMRGNPDARALGANKIKPVKENRTHDPLLRQVDELLFSFFGDCRIHLDRYYHHSHFWFRIKDHRCDVGISPLLLKILQPLTRVILPEENSVIRSNQLTVIIVRENQTIPLYCPVKGRITRINSAFLTGGIEYTFLKDEYLFRMEIPEIKIQAAKSPAPPEQRDTLAEDIQHLSADRPRFTYFSSNLELLKSELTPVLRENLPAQTGFTMADGGLPEKNLEKIIGKQNYQKLLTKMLKKINL